MKKLFIYFALFLLLLILIGCTTKGKNEARTAVCSTGQVEEATDQFSTIVTIPDDLDIPSLQDIHEMYAGRLFTMDDFSSLVPGVSKASDIFDLTPYYLHTPYAVGSVYQYPAADGCYIYIVCADTVQAIYLDSSSTFVGVLEFQNMVDNPSLRPPVGRWK